MGWNSGDSEHGNKDEGEGKRQNPPNPLAQYRQHQSAKKHSQQQPNTQASAPHEEEVVAARHVPQTETNTEAYKGKTAMNDILNMFNPGQPLIQSAAGGDEMGKFIDAGNKFLEANKNRLSMGGKTKWQLIPVPGHLTGFQLDSVVLAAAFTYGDVKFVGAITAVMMGRQQLPKQEVTEGQRRYVFSAVPSDVWTEGFKGSVINQVQKNVGLGADVPVVLFGAVTVPVTFGYSEREVDEVITNLINTAAYSMYDELTQGDHQFKLEDIIPENYEVSGRVTYAPGDDSTVFGEPLRRDLSLQVTTGPAGRKGQVNALEGNRNSNLVQIDGFTDYIYLGPKDGGRRRGGSRARRREVDELDIYALGLNLTKIASNNNFTTEMNLLGLSTVSALMREDCLVKSLRPVGDSADLRDARALEVEQLVEFDPPIPADPSEVEWAELNEAVVQEDSLNVFLHIEKSGLQTRTQRLYLEAADDKHPNHRQARIQLWEAAHRLTGGVIEDYLDEATPFGALEERIILLGHWTDSKGRIRDLRELDRFFMMTHFGLAKNRDLEAIAMWDDACWNRNISEEARLAKMEEIIASVTGSYTITGHAYLVQINPDWLYKLTQAVDKAGLTIPTEGLLQDSVRRGYFDNRFGGSGNYNGNTFNSRGGYGFGR
ncbi:hypothetical protein [Erwinia phage vB_Ea277G]|jgi:hypothetical protein|nr:hypothetical protein [Erwinia phage vB_Ea277G]